MAERRVTMDELIEILRQRAGYQHERNLILVALPLQTAPQDARRLAQALDAEYVDFDCQLIQALAADDWNDHVALERRGTLSIGQTLARDWLRQDVAQRISRQRPVVVGNVNLAVRYDVDVAGALYDATERGLCIIAAGGRIQGQALLIHGTFQQTGASSPAYEIVPPPDDGPPKPPRAVQDRFI